MTLKTHLPLFISATLIALSAFGVLCGADPAKPTAPALPFIAVPVKLDTPGYLTAVIEDKNGLRACNLVGEYKSPAGKMTFNWDFYDVGIQPGTEFVKRDGKDVEVLKPYLRHLVKPGTYKVRGLVHDGIVMKYEQSVYSPGTPPWKTADMSGTWMGDHANPFDVLFIDKGPNGQPTLVLATGSAEAGHALSFCDLTGKKYKGVNSDNFNGADSLKNDRKPGADQNKLYFINGNGLCTLGENDRHVVILKPTRKKPLPVLGDYAYGDLAVYGGLAVLSESDNRANIDTTTGNLLVVDLATKTELCNLVTGVSRGIAFGTDGKLYALIDGNLVRYQWDAAKKTLVEEAKVITGLISPQRVFIDSAGQFYISVFGDAHQVLVFDKAGKKLRTIGKPGGAQIGPYDEQRMERPYGVAVTPASELWVAEQTAVPKRISVWDAKTGAFKKAIYGGPQYGGGGTLDPADKTIFYYPHLVSPVNKALMVFKLDWQTGAYKLTDIPMRTSLCGRKLAQKWGGPDAGAPEEKEQVFTSYDAAFNVRRSGSPHMAVHTDGHRYLFNRGYRADTTFYSIIWRWDEGKDAIAVPVAIIGTVGDMFRDDKEGLFDKSADRVAIVKARDRANANGFVWSDRNSDQQVTADELQFYVIPGDKLQWGSLAGSYIKDDLSFAAWHLNGGMVPAPTIDAKGVPLWDLTRITPLGIRDMSKLNHQGLTPVMGTDFNVFGAMGWDYFSNPQGYDRATGVLKWSYKYSNIWNVPQYPGQLIAGMGSLGRMVKPKAGEAGEIWSTSCEKGSCYMFTADGLFLKTLGGDVRTTPLWRYPTAERGMTVDGVSFEDECFLITLNQGSDGEVYVAAGKEHVSIVRIDGLQTVKRKDFGTITITPEMLKGLPDTLEEPIVNQVRKTLEVPLGGTAPVVDGKLDEWATAAGVNVDIRTKVQLWFAKDRIYGNLRTNDPTLLDNVAADPRFLFKFGGAIDLFFGAKWNPGNVKENNPYQEGDCRVLIAKIKGKPTAVLYRPVAPSAAKSEECIFVSPIGREVFQSVTEITDGLEFAEDGKGNFEFSLPMDRVLRHRISDKPWAPVTDTNLGIQDWHQDKCVILGDIGFIRGNGTQNVQRVCWNNLDTWMTSDIPTEARWRSLNWGMLKLVRP